MRDFYFRITFKNDLPDSFHLFFAEKEDRIAELFLSSSKEEGITHLYQILDAINNLGKLKQWMINIFRDPGKGKMKIKKRQDVTLLIRKRVSSFKYEGNDKKAQDLDMPTGELKAILILWIRFMESNISAL
jgi:hypothetical protein